MTQETLWTVARRYGVVTSTAWRWRQRLGVVIKRPVIRSRPLPAWSRARSRLLAVVGPEWCTGAALALELGVSRQMVYQTMRRLEAEGGVEYRCIARHLDWWLKGSMTR